MNTLILILALQQLRAQSFIVHSDVGVGAGVSSYIGDINLRKLMYQPNFYARAHFKHHFTPHHNLRFCANFGILSGADSLSNNDFQRFRNAAFSRSLLDLQVGYEFNFLPYNLHRKRFAHTPYLMLGVGYSLVFDEISHSHFTIPFGFGYKIRPKEWFELGIEYSFRKTAFDGLDNVYNTDLPQDKSFIQNNDWYSFLGFYVSFQVFKQQIRCPAYD